MDMDYSPATETTVISLTEDELNRLGKIIALGIEAVNRLDDSDSLDWEDIAFIDELARKTLNRPV